MVGIFLSMDFYIRLVTTYLIECSEVNILSFSIVDIRAAWWYVRKSNILFELGASV